jgi:hypothetical protein
LKHQNLTRTCRLLLPNTQIQSGSKLTSDLGSTFSRCPSDFYLLIRQPGVGVSDFSSRTSAPTLSRFLDRTTHSTLRSSVTIPEIVGDIDLHSLEQELKSKCGAGSIAVDASGRQTILTVVGLSLTSLQRWLHPRFSILLHRCLASTSQYHPNLNQSAAKTC